MGAQPSLVEAFSSTLLGSGKKGFKITYSKQRAETHRWQALSDTGRKGGLSEVSGLSWGANL